MKTCLYPGSFDPVTLGHLDVIERAAKQYDRVVVAVLVNSRKEPLFTAQERVEMLRRCCGHIPNVEIASFDGLLVEFAKQVGACAVVRGLRAVMDFEYEFQLASLNRMLDDQIETVFFMTNTQYMFLSSSMVKEIGLLGGDFSGMVPACLYADIAKAMEKKGRK